MSPTKTDWGRAVNHLTNVGAYTASPSPYGTFDQGGDVVQRTETSVNNGLWRDSPGTFAFNSDVDFMLSTVIPDENGGPGGRADFIGFRVAALPEPSTLILGALGGLALLVYRRRK
jgi:formylglycine-generating enzyme